MRLQRDCTEFSMRSTCRYLCKVQGVRLGGRRGPQFRETPMHIDKGCSAPPSTEDCGATAVLCFHTQIEKRWSQDKSREYT